MKCDTYYCFLLEFVNIQKNLRKNRGNYQVKQLWDESSSISSCFQRPYSTKEVNQIEKMVVSLESAQIDTLWEFFTRRRVALDLILEHYFSILCIGGLISYSWEVCHKGIITPSLTFGNMKLNSVNFTRVLLANLLFKLYGVFVQKQHTKHSNLKLRSSLHSDSISNSHNHIP